MGSLAADPIGPVLLGITGIVFFAIIGRHVAQRLGQPAVQGELLIGVVLGNLGYFVGFDLVLVLREGPVILDLLNVAIHEESVAAAADAAFGRQAPELLGILQGPDGGVFLLVAHVVDVFSRYGVIFLLFLVGIDNSVDQMKAVGAASFRVALFGVLLPFGLTFLVMAGVTPGLPWRSGLFVAATFAATSIGITASVLEELKADQSTEGRVILGAAVLDDVFGLLVLAVVSGIVVSGGINAVDISRTSLSAVAFLFASLWLGPYLIRGIVRSLRSFDPVETKVFSAFLFVMILAWVASFAGLASIVGAFAAGLILHDDLFVNARPEERCLTLKELVRPFEIVLAPIFFVAMGLQVKIEDLLSVEALLLAGALTVAASVGKLMSGWGSGPATNHWMIGLGMMPRGEVALIFASIGKTLGVLSDAVFSAVILAVACTAVLAPALMRRAVRTPTARAKER